MHETLNHITPSGLLNVIIQATDFNPQCRISIEEAVKVIEEEKAKLSPTFLNSLITFVKA